MISSQVYEVQILRNSDSWKSCEERFINRQSAEGYIAQNKLDPARVIKQTREIVFWSESAKPELPITY